MTDGLCLLAIPAIDLNLKSTWGENVKKIFVFLLILFGINLPTLANDSWGEVVWLSFEGDKMYLADVKVEPNGMLSSWVMFDLKVPLRDSRNRIINSTQFFLLLNCNDKTAKQTQLTDYSGHEGKGVVVSSSNGAPRFTKFAPDDFENSIYLTFCKK